MVLLQFPASKPQIDLQSKESSFDEPLPQMTSKSLFTLDQSESLVNEIVIEVQLKSLASNLKSLYDVYILDQAFLVNYSGPIHLSLPILPTSQISALSQIKLLSLVLTSWNCSKFLIFSNLGILNQLILF